MHKEHVDFNFIDIFFTAVSAVSVTGLTVVSTVDTFNTAGLVGLLIVLQLGGMGVMATGTFVWLMMGKKIGLKERQLIMVDQNQSQMAGLVSLVKEILTILIVLEVLGVIALGLRFLAYYDTWQEAFFQGLFASVNAVTNGGFDITGSSLVPYAHDYFVQAVNFVLMIGGAIGFPILIECKQYIMSKNKHQFRFSLFTKLTSLAFGGLVIGGAVVILFYEWNHYFAGMSLLESLSYVVFHSATTRSSGLATLDVNQFTEPTIIFIAFMMFIGGSPNSVGGGIRTTTFAVVLLSIYNYSRGRQTIKIFRRQIAEEDVTKAFIVTTTGVLVCSVASMILLYTEKGSFTSILFEICSAFGTIGLSSGVSAEATVIGKLVLIFLMFIGRIGTFSFLFLLKGQSVTDKYQYPMEPLIIG